MQNTHRIYYYAITWINLEIALWGSIRFIRSAMDAGWERIASQQAGELSLILISLPVFLIHWSLAQRSALRSSHERASRARIIFLYGVLVTTLLPAALSLIALLSRLFLPSASQVPVWAFISGNQTPADLSVAMFLNLLAASYFFAVLRNDWQFLAQEEAVEQAQGLFQVFWVVFGLGLAVLGAQQILQFGLARLASNGSGEDILLAKGLASFLVGAPLWVYGLRRQASLRNSADANAQLILIARFILVTLVAAAALIASGLVLRTVLLALLEAEFDPFKLLTRISQPFSVALPLGFVWVYFGRTFLEELRSAPESPIHNLLRRIFFYLFAFLGLVFAFTGVQVLLRSMIEATSGGLAGWDAAGKARAANALAGLLLGLPVWIFAWRRAAVEMKERGEAGERARRSWVRKAYLYTVLFLGAIGGLFALGEFLSGLLRAASGSPAGRSFLELAHSFKDVLLFALLWGVHFYLKKEDARLTERSLAKRYSLYPVLVLDAELDNFAARMVETLEVEAPGLPVAVHSIRDGAPDESLSAAKAVILPAEMAIRPPESLRLWLQAYPGVHLVVTAPVKGWHWITGTRTPLRRLAERTARIVRKLAEGEEIQ